MLTIRLQRTGTKNKPAFRVVLAEAYRAASKQVLEVLGHYNPKSKDFGIKDESRLKYWIAQHVSISPTVYNLLVEKKLVEGKKVKAWQPRKSGEAGSQAKPDQALPGGKTSAGKEAAAPATAGASLAPEGREAVVPPAPKAAAPAEPVVTAEEPKVEATV